jgi:hypothetical protein
MDVPIIIYIVRFRNLRKYASNMIGTSIMDDLCIKTVDAIIIRPAKSFQLCMTSFQELLYSSLFFNKIYSPVNSTQMEVDCLVATIMVTNELAIIKTTNKLPMLRRDPQTIKYTFLIK